MADPADERRRDALFGRVFATPAGAELIALLRERGHFLTLAEIETRLRRARALGRRAAQCQGGDAMTAANFSACLAIVLANEGGFVDDAEDPGGATNLGVTLRAWSAWTGRTATIGEIGALTSADVAPLYLADYFNAAHCPEVPGGVDLMVFDEAVNQGVGRAIRSLQAAAHTPADGLFGPATSVAVRMVAPEVLISAIAADREALYRALPGFVHFGAGWQARVARTKAAALAMVRP